MSVRLFEGSTVKQYKEARAKSCRNVSSVAG